MRYPGGKNAQGMAQRIVSLMPPHRMYVEGCYGSGAVMRLKRPAEINIAVDMIEPPAGAVPAGVQVIRGDVLEFLRTTQLRPDAVLYLDPPYMLGTREKKKLYAHEWPDAKHAAMLGLVLSLPCRVILSGYPCRLYNEILAGWQREEFQAFTRGRTWKTECLWYNFPRPAVLHDARFIGGGRDERWRIQKRRRTLRARFQRMPPNERQALFDVLCEVMGRAGHLQPPETAASTAQRVSAVGAGVGR